MKLEVGKLSGVPVEVAFGVEVDTEIVMPTVLHRLSVKSMVSSLSSDKCPLGASMRLTL